VFLTVALVGSLVVVGVLVRESRWPAAGAAAVAVIYFAVRLFGGLGRGGRE